MMMSEGDEGGDEELKERKGSGLGWHHETLK